MIILPVVDLIKVKGITAMFCGLLHGDAKSAITDANISSLIDSRRGFRCVRSMPAANGPGSAAHALPMKQEASPAGAERCSP